jgi:putative colanic acid biosynthesis glycosyltransferase WcaI
MKVLLLNQCFWPDVVATAQQLTMLARRLSQQGHQVTVITSRRGYDNQQLIFPKRERWQGIEIFRISSLSLGKTSRWRRSVDFGSFLLTCVGRLLLTPRHDVVVALTSPPLISWIGSVFTHFKGGKLVFWPMDLNPDEAIAAGWLKENSLTARFLTRLLKSSMVRAKSIVALDRFMKERIAAKGIDASKIEVIPPALDDGVRYDKEGREEFRRQHDLTDKFVVMYAGNHSPCNPLDTLLATAAALKTRQSIVFLFVGGGSAVEQVKQFAAARGLANIRCLPYQPYEKLSALLSAADLHVVVLGDAFRGILHPSKIYNILAVGSAVLFVGPEECHVTDLFTMMKNETPAVRARHGEWKKIAESISTLSQRLTHDTGRDPVELDQFSGDRIYASFINLLEHAGANPAAPVGQIEPGAPASQRDLIRSEP